MTYINSSLADIEVLECLQRPYEVRTQTLTVPNVGVTKKEVGGANFVLPSIGSSSVWTAKPTNRIPGHTGYLITATLHHKHSLSAH